MECYLAFCRYRGYDVGTLMSPSARLTGTFGTRRPAVGGPRDDMI